MILMQRTVKVDGKIRTDATYPAGFMDVIQIEKTNDTFRLLFDTKGKFAIQRISPEEAKFKLCKVKRYQIGRGNIPYISTHDGRTIRYPHPSIRVNDTIKFDLVNGKIIDFVKFDVGNLVMVTGGRNLGRVGLVTHKEKHPGSVDIVHVKDSAGQSFATRTGNVFVIGKGNKSWVTLPRNLGVKKSIVEEAEERAKKRAEAAAKA